jgi:hypothetical protein
MITLGTHGDANPAEEAGEPAPAMSAEWSDGPTPVRHPERDEVRRSANIILPKTDGSEISRKPFDASLLLLLYVRLQRIFIRHESPTKSQAGPMRVNTCCEMIKPRDPADSDRDTFLGRVSPNRDTAVTERRVHPASDEHAEAV